MSAMVLSVRRAAAVLGPLGGLVLLACAEPPRQDLDQPPGSIVLATVDGDAVTARDLESILPATRTGDAPPLPSPEAILKRLTQNRLLEMEGYRIGADTSRQVRSQVQERVRERSIRVLMDSVSAEARNLDPPGLDSLLGVTSTMDHVAHIAVKEETLARSLLDSLRAGRPFADLARRHSADTTSAPAGGDLGWSRTGGFGPEFGEVLAGLEVGGVEGPVRTAVHWHIIKLIDRRVETAGQSVPMREALRDGFRRERVMATLQSYIASLKDAYGVVVHDSLLASLDYGSSDPDVQTRLQTDDATLAELPAGRLTVRGLTRRIRFRYFHGVQGKPDVARIRDEMFEEMLTESLLWMKASEIGLNRRPGILEEANTLERELVREAVLNLLLGSPFEPSEEEIADFYADHLDTFTPAPMFRARGVLLGSQESALQFRRGLEGGASLKWLAESSADVLDPNPAIFSEWLTAEELGAPAGEPDEGMILGPTESGQGWLVATVTATRQLAPTPLADCRDGVLRLMKSVWARETVTEALARLEAAARIDIRPGALETITELLHERGFSVEGPGEDGPAPTGEEATP